MLNVSPKANGVIPQEQQDILLEIGAWLDFNGEAIYGTSPWQTFGEGPTKQEKEGMFLDWINYTPQDIRFTKKQNVIYAIVLGWPGENTSINLKSFSEENIKDQSKIKAVSVLGSEEDISYELNKEGLQLHTPQIKLDDKAFVFKIELEN